MNSVRANAARFGINLKKSPIKRYEEGRCFSFLKLDSSGGHLNFYWIYEIPGFKIGHIFGPHHFDW